MMAVYLYIERSWDLVASSPRMEDLFPKEILDAIGGVEAMEQLPLHPFVPAEIGDLLFSPKEKEMIERGWDAQGTPFLIAYCLGLQPIIYCSEQGSPSTNLQNWRAIEEMSSFSLAGNGGQYYLSSLSKIQNLIRLQRNKPSTWIPLDSLVD